MGDFNINLLECETDNAAKNFADTLASQSFLPTITKPTRITEGTATLIDNILTNDFVNHTTGILETDLSDHLPVFLIADTMHNHVQNKQIYKKRHITDTIIQHFIHDLSTSDWNVTAAQNNVHDVYDNFLDHILKLYDKHFPLKEVKCRYNRCKSPWLSAGIYNSIRRKNFLYKKFLKNTTLQNKSTYTLYKNKLNSLIRTSKKRYFSSQFETRKGNVKGTWNVINSVLNKGKHKPNPSYIIQDGVTIEGDKDISDAFNDYFVSVGAKLASKLPPCNTAFESFLEGKCHNSLFLSPITHRHS